MACFKLVVNEHAIRGSHYDISMFCIFVGVKIIMHQAGTGVHRDLLIVQEQNYWVELFSGPIISSQGNYEVVEPISCHLCRHYNQLILEAIRLSILKAIMFAALGGDRVQQEVVRLLAEKSPYSLSVINKKNTKKHVGKSNSSISV